MWRTAAATLHVFAAPTSEECQAETNFDVVVVEVEEGERGRALRGLGVRIKTDVGAENQRSRGPARRRDGLTIRAQRAHFTATSSKPMGFCALLRWGERGEGGL